MATTDFSAWLDAVDLDETEQIYSLYTAVSDEESGGFFDVTTNNGRIFVKVGHVQETLMIASQEAKSVFLKMYRASNHLTPASSRCFV